MIEKDGHFEIELEDVLRATDLGTNHVVDDWPWGRKQRCSMHFFVEFQPYHGERFVKQSTFKGRTYKPKLATYATCVKIIELDGKIGHVEYNAIYGTFNIYIEDGKYRGPAFFEDEAKRLKAHFFE